MRLARGAAWEEENASVAHPADASPMVCLMSTSQCQRPTTRQRLILGHAQTQDLALSANSLREHTFCRVGSILTPTNALRGGLTIRV